MENNPKKVAIVTGGSRGIGAAICRRLASDGINVIVQYFSSEQSANDIVRDIKNSDGGAKAIQAEITAESDVKRLFEETIKTFGRLDIVIVSAGVPMDSLISKFTITNFHKVFDVNVLGVLLCMREASSRLGKNGRFIALSSGLTKRTIPKTGLYTASKSAVESLVETFAKEIADHGVTVNSILPGPTTPGMFDRRSEKDRKHFADMSLFKRLGTANEIAAAVSWLASDAAGWITGQNISVDGGVFN